MFFFLLSALLAQPAAHAAPPAAMVCTGVDGNLPAGLAPWIHLSALTPILRPGVTIPATPGTTVTIEIAEAGTYGVAIDTGAWIDVSRDDQPLRPAAHGHGPACSTIRKIVDFQLEPGRYTILLSRTEATAVRLLVIRR
jgi:hypothetical protein